MLAKKGKIRVFSTADRKARRVMREKDGNVDRNLKRISIRKIKKL